MSINTVMISNPFILLPDEKIKYTSPKTRTSFTLTRQNTSGETLGKVRDIKAIGKCYLTNKRLVVITTEGDFKSLNVLHGQVKSHKLASSQDKEAGFWKNLLTVGANAFEMLIFTQGRASDIGLDSGLFYKLHIKFNDGGIYDFVKVFENIYNDYVNDQVQDEQLPLYSE